MKDFLAIIGGIASFCCAALIITFLASLVHQCVDALKCRRAYKHRFDKPTLCSRAEHKKRNR